MFSTSIVTLEERTAFVDFLAGRGSVSFEFGRQPAHSRGQIVMVRANRIIRRLSASPAAQVSDAVAANLGALAAAFVERLQQDGDISVTAQQSEQYAHALRLDKPRSRRSLYYLTRETFVSEAGQLSTFDRVFAEVFGEPAGADRYREQTSARAAALV